jgi:hypothetical protein
VFVGIRWILSTMSSWFCDLSSLCCLWSCMLSVASRYLGRVDASDLRELTQCFLFSTFSFCWVLEVITTVMTSPYHLYFIFVPRRTSNCRKVRFGEVVVLKQISTLHHKYSWKFSAYLFYLRFLVHMPQVISKLSLVLHFSIWATEDFQKKLIFTSCSVLIDFCHYLCLPLDHFLFKFSWSRNFWESCYSSLCFNLCYTWVETEPKE